MPINDPIFYLSMNDTDVSEPVYTDRGSGGNNGTAVNGPLTSVAGAKSGLGQARSFNGTNQYIDTGTTVLSGASQGTLSMWFRRNAGEYAYFLAKESGGNPGVGLEIYPTVAYFN